MAEAAGTKSKATKRVKAPKDDHNDSWHEQNLEEIDQLDDEIKALEKKLGLNMD